MSHCYWITGFPAAGKTTLAQALVQALQQRGSHACLLDGDELRGGLCADLGMSDADRAENVRRVGEVARLLLNAGVVPVCALVSPFAQDREQVRSRFATGQFIEIHLNTPIGICQQRDPKHLYARARRGELSNVTGVDGVYQPPLHPEFRLDAHALSVDDMVRIILGDGPR